jgi:uncharacterized protein (UPF0333 family)
MLMRQKQNKRKGSVLVEYALLIAGIVLVSVVAIAVLGHKTSDVVGIMAAVMPGAHADDNKPIASSTAMPLDKTGATIKLDSTQLVNGTTGVDRYEDVLGAGGGQALIVD